MPFSRLTDEQRKKLTNKQYWEKRSIQGDKELLKMQKDLAQRMQRVYVDSYNKIGKELNDFMMKYADANKLDYNEVTKTLTPIELQEYMQTKNKWAELFAENKNKRYGNYIEKELVELDSRKYVTRLQALMDNINYELSKDANAFQMTLDDTLYGLFTDQYKGVSELMGIFNPQIPDAVVRKILEYPYYGQMFADSVWKNKTDLLNYLHREFVHGIIRGDSIQKMSRELKSKTSVRQWQAERLVRTETNYVYNQAHLKGYEDSGVVKEYEILAHNDKRTSNVCKGFAEGSRENRTFKLSEAVVGVNHPPFHPSCRSTIIPVIKDW